MASNKCGILLATCLMLFAFGCGDAKRDTGPELAGSKITGKVLQGGKPIKILKDETVRIAFVGAEDSKLAAGADLKEDGTFEVVGPSGKGMPAGKYKVSFTSEIYGGGGNRFAEKLDADTTTIYADVSGGGSDNFEIDITTKKIAKK